MARRPRRDPITAIGLLLEAASYLHRAIDGDVTRLTGLPGHWFDTLLRLQQSDPGGVRMNDVAAQVSLPPSSFSRLADKMETEGLVKRSPDPTNRRATLLQLTATGEKRLADAIVAYEPVAKARFGDLLTDQELEALEAITRKIRDGNWPPAATRADNGQIPGSIRSTDASMFVNRSWRA